MPMPPATNTVARRGLERRSGCADRGRGPCRPAAACRARTPNRRGRPARAARRPARRVRSAGSPHSEYCRTRSGAEDQVDVRARLPGGQLGAVGVAQGRGRRRRRRRSGRVRATTSLELVAQAATAGRSGRAVDGGVAGGVGRAATPTARPGPRRRARRRSGRCRRSWSVPGHPVDAVDLAGAAAGHRHRLARGPLARGDQPGEDPAGGQAAGVDVDAQLLVAGRLGGDAPARSTLSASTSCSTTVRLFSRRNVGDLLVVEGEVAGDRPEVVACVLGLRGDRVDDLDVEGVRVGAVRVRAGRRPGRSGCAAGTGTAAWYSMSCQRVIRPSMPVDVA